MRAFFTLVMLSLLLSACGESGQESSALEPDEFADMIFVGGPIWTANDARPAVEAVAVRDGRIIHAGGEAAARALAGEGTEIIDLHGAALYPGFVDAHVHLVGIGLRELTLNLDDVTSIEMLKDRLAGVVAEAEAGAQIIGRGWIGTHWPEARFPTRDDLDSVSPDNPVILRRADGHAVVVNTLALERAGIDAHTEPPFGGEILKDDNGRPTGMLIDRAMALVGEAMDETGGPDARLALLTAGTLYTGLGWTGVHSMSVTPANADLMAALADAGALKLRVYNSIDGDDPASLALLTDGPRASANGRVVTRAIKLYMDGALGSRGALLLAPYNDAPGAGLQLSEKAAALSIMTGALRAGIQVNMHAIGDRGNRQLLDWVEEAFAQVPVAERAIAEPRWRDEHAQIINPADIPRFAALGVIPSMQPSHAIGDLFFAPARLGKDRLKGAYAWRSLIDAGSIIAGGSDAPVEKGDPRIEFYAAVARKSLDGFSNEDWHPEEAVSRAEALKMFTAWPAYASFREDDLGSIEVGKRADLTIFSGDIMTIPEAEILTVLPLMTVIEGEIVFRAEGF